MLNFACGCGEAIELPDGMVGEPLDCPSCRKILRVISGPNSTSFDEDLLPWLSVRSGPERIGEQFALAGDAPIEIGKLPDRLLSLVGTRVSRTHCRLLRQGGRWAVEDNKSTNGLFVNGRRVTGRQILGNGDLVTIGEFELEFHDASGKYETVSDAGGGIDLDSVGDAYDIIEEPTIVKVPMTAAAKQAVPVKLGPDAIKCPSCTTMYAKTTKICVSCGIDIKSGRAILMASDLDENALYANTESIIRVLSWFLWLGMAPIASDAYGSKKPYAIWGIALLTILISVGVWATDASSGPAAAKNLMLWTGREPTARDIERGALLNEYTHWGNGEAFEKKLPNKPESEIKDAEIEKAYNTLEPEDQFYGQFHWYQLITNGFLHEGFMHLAGNMVFMLVFGSRVNALIGQWKTLALYPILLVLASLTHMASEIDHAPMPALGASGAIMGLAGMYLVLFPINRVFMVAWIRLGLIFRFRSAIKIFAIRGFWVVLFYMAFDVIATVLGSKDGTAHWAHLGGFGAGFALALILLIARQIDANRTDLFSLALGKNAWQILGKPGAPQMTAA